MDKSLTWMVFVLAVALHGVKADYVGQQTPVVPGMPSTKAVNSNLAHNAAHQASIMPGYLPGYNNVPIYTSDLKNEPKRVTFPISLVPSQLYYTQHPAKMPSSIYCLSSQVYGSQLPNHQIKYSSYQMPNMYNKLTAPAVNAGPPTAYETSPSAY